jgi:hypothetical protein
VNTLITNNVHRRLEEPFHSVAAALQRLEPVQPLRDALAALGVDELVSVRGTEVPAATASGTATFSLTWQLADAGPAHVAWTLSVTPFGDHNSLLSASIRAGTDSPAAGQKLLAAWPLLGRIVEAHTTRRLNAVTEHAEQLTDTSLGVTAARLSAAA